MTDSILIIDDDGGVLMAAKLLFKRHFSSVVTTNRPADIPSLFSDHSFDVVLLDRNFSPGERTGREGLGGSRKYWIWIAMQLWC